jgi:arsenate reductase
MKRILFVCIGNSCRSPMAEGFANYYGKGWVEAFSAGTYPAGYISPHAITAMEEKGINLAVQCSRGLTSVDWRRIDQVIALDLSIAPQVRSLALNAEFIQWIIPDPVGESLDFFRQVRDQIEEKVLDFVDAVRKEE